MSDTTKSEQIMALFKQGKSSAEIIRMGFAPGTTYGVRRKMRSIDRGVEPATMEPVSRVIHTRSQIEELSDNSEEEIAVHSLETDPQVLDLHKRIRIAELEHKLAVIQSSPEIENRVAFIEDKLAKILDLTGDGDPIDIIFTALEMVQSVLPSYLVDGLGETYSCFTCDTRGAVALAIHCTNCGTDANWGGWLDSQTNRNIQ